MFTCYKNLMIIDKFKILLMLQYLSKIGIQCKTGSLSGEYLYDQIKLVVPTGIPHAPSRKEDNFQRHKKPQIKGSNYRGQ